MQNNRRLDRNALIIALFFMQYTYLIPVMHFISSTMAVGIWSVGLLLVLLFTNNIGILNWKIVGLYFILLFLFMLKVLMGRTAVSTIGFVILFTLPEVSLFLFPFNYSSCVNYLIKIARVSFFVIAWIPFIFEYNYMRFGYGMLPVLILMYIDILYNRQKGKTEKKTGIRTINSGILLVGFVEMLLYGARGCLLALFIFIALDRLLINQKHVFRNAMLFILVVAIVINIEPILNLAERLAEKMGMYSYSITKFKMQLAGGFEYASSGRIDIYIRAVDKIKASPLFGGYIEMNEEGGDYAHNIFLQVGEDFGVIAIFIVTIFILRVLFRIGSKKVIFDEKVLLILLFSTSIGRLLFSSTLWRRPEFWMLVSMMIATKRNRQYNDGHSIMSIQGDDGTS